MYKVYVIKSVRRHNRYVGSTEDVEKRIAEHNAGKCRYTKGRLPWKLIHLESCHSRSEAMQKEKFLKSGQGRKWLDKILSNS
ncbi:MAG: hypothetical protein A3A43_03095 [Candidatus Liptonbacteria bacterium RIFCSPLOWO2_01_FULL_56_20]|uniref:GIY-YIG domain-containing protein n=1 Tax=Candidatus Liptonbacteria bacterium RIFCSPLOWO2_01_FULL_56_20 TaxID=1798652 RepID=A0A1G2CIX9_9BACT|nr:MAG: hypothetical protein A2681_02205 [Candidatus Liptonbacteria bacterium RIFCSPHIGHO2_01_FULL_56_18b]OGZ01356.1 MAG: hypothetical protein A3A43_03095 [Candidatus Liptonbacteria bacterium RIFCSPLOWO2_01_FULL_56_20]